MKDIDFNEIQKKAFELGWNDVGIAPAIIPEEDIKAYRKWLRKGFQADMDYMENQVRCYPDQLLPGAKTAIIFVTHYKQERKEFRKNEGLVASYARGRDYHRVHHKKLKKFINWFEERIGMKNIAKGFSDSTPILEKALAVQAGLGWFGKNTLLIHRKFGTFVLLSGLLTTIEITYPVKDLRLPKCGSCQRCIDACPTKALRNPYELDAARCLSFHLIESKKNLPEEISQKNPGYIFGCDICQDACPHNLRKEISQAPEFSPEQGIGEYLTYENIKEIEKDPKQLFGTPLQRRKAKGLSHTAEHLWKI